MEPRQTPNLQPKEPFEFTTHIRYSEVDESGRATLPAIIDLFQDCSTFQSESLGVGMAWLKEKRRGWFLTHWHIIVDRRPGTYENVAVGTFASRFKGITAERNFYLRDESGALPVRANSHWAFVDLDTGKPTRPSPEHVEPYGLHEPLEMPDAPRKIAPPDELESRDAFVIRRHHIDTNGHVNNCEYVRAALDLLPEGALIGGAAGTGAAREIRELRVDYRRSAVLGDIVCPKVAHEPDRTVVELRDPQGAPFATIEFK